MVQLVSQPMIIAGTVDRPTKTLRDVIEAAKAAPDQWSYASAGGVGSSHHVTGELLNLLAGTNIQHVPYRGGGAAMTDAISGQIPLIIIGAGPVIPQLQAGKLRAYAIDHEITPRVAAGCSDYFGIRICRLRSCPMVWRLDSIRHITADRSNVSTLKSTRS